MATGVSGEVPGEVPPLAAELRMRAMVGRKFEMSRRIRARIAGR